MTTAGTLKNRLAAARTKLDRAKVLSVKGDAGIQKAWTEEARAASLEARRAAAKQTEKAGMNIGTQTKDIPRQSAHSMAARHFKAAEHHFNSGDMKQGQGEMDKGQHWAQQANNMYEPEKGHTVSYMKDGREHNGTVGDVGSKDITIHNFRDPGTIDIRPHGEYTFENKGQTPPTVPRRFYRG